MHKETAQGKIVPTSATRAHIDRATLRRRELNAMATRFPRLKTVLNLQDGDPDKLHREACTLIPLFHRPAAEAAYRSALKIIASPGAHREIALSDLREGIPYSANVRAIPDLWEAARPEVRAHEEAYGAAVFTQAWPSLSRGRAIAYYFSHHIPRGNVLHIAPEPEAEALLRAHVQNYQTLGLGANTDLAEDLTALPLPDASFDLVICHRVLEHIFDESAALSEMKRILRPGGILNISVPESMHLPEALDWCVPDATHHDHYRQYGSDFARRLGAAGFDVQPRQWLIEQPAERLREAGTYPLRMYNAVR